MRNEELYVQISCGKCGTEIEVQVTEEYLLEEKKWKYECSVCGYSSHTV